MHRFLKFIVIGGMNTAIDWGILNILLVITGTQSVWGYAICKTIGFSVAVANSYFFNKRWVFRDTKKYSMGQVGSFVFVNLIGLAINAGIASFVVQTGGWGISFILCANLGAAFATGASLIWNFAGYRLLVFRSKV